MSVNTGTFLGEDRETLVFLQAPKRQQSGGTFRVYSYSHEMFEYTLYLRYTDTRVVHEGVMEQAGGAQQHNITETPSKLKLGEDG